MGYMERKDAGTDVLDKPTMPAEMIAMLKDVTAAVQALRETKADDTRRNATEVALKFEDFKQKFDADMRAYKDAVAAAEKKAEDSDKRAKDLETKIASGGIGHNGGPRLDDEVVAREAPEYKSFFEYFKANDPSQLKQETKALLRTDQDTAGGYLIPPVMDTQIRKKVVELSPVRAFAMSRTMTGKSMSVPQRLALLDSAYEGEAEQDSTDASKYGETTVTVFRHQVTVPVTLDQLIMSPYNMEVEISSDVGQSFAKKEGKLFLTGTGSKMPEGILNNAQVLAGKTVTAATGLLTFDDIANLIGSMKMGYNPMLYFNRVTFAQLIQLKDGYGRPLWQPVAGEKPAMIWDQPYTATFIDMDSMIQATYTSGAVTANATSNTVPIMYADLRQGYEIFDLMGMSVLRDDLTRKRNAIIEYTFRRYNTAKVLMPEAIKLLKVK